MKDKWIINLLSLIHVFFVLTGTIDPVLNCLLPISTTSRGSLSPNKKNHGFQFQLGKTPTKQRHTNTSCIRGDMIGIFPCLWESSIIKWHITPHIIPVYFV